MGFDNEARCSDSILLDMVVENRYVVLLGNILRSLSQASHNDSRTPRSRKVFGISSLQDAPCCCCKSGCVGSGADTAEALLESLQRRSRSINMAPS